MNPYRIFSFVLSFIIVVLLIATHISHGWTWFNPNIDIYSAGLWVTCSEDGQCTPLPSINVFLDITRSFMVLGLLSSIIALLWSVEWDHVVHCNFIFVPKALMTSIFGFFSGVFVLLAVVVFAVQVDQKAVPGPRKWAFYLSYGITSLCFFSGIYNMVTYKLSLWGTGTSTTHVNDDTLSFEDHHPHMYKASII